VVQVILNLLGKALTSPFALLGSLSAAARNSPTWTSPPATPN